MIFITTIPSKFSPILCLFFGVMVDWLFFYGLIFFKNFVVFVFGVFGCMMLYYFFCMTLFLYA